MALCNYCGKAPAIANSHVVPKFLGNYIKRNSPFDYVLNLWEQRPQYDLDKGPYLCRKCDNQVIGAWESYYAANLWPDPLKARAAWGDVRAINFLVSLAYRYALHFHATSPIAANAPYSTYFRDLTVKALTTSAEVGKSLFVYPYIHQPIEHECALLPGINHLLNLAVHGLSLPREGNLPNAMLVMTPKVLVLFCDADLAASSDCMMKTPWHLAVGAAFDPRVANVDMLVFLATILNRYVGEGWGHQKELGLWKRLAYGTDKRFHPKKMCYLAQAQDKALSDWQKNNCPPDVGASR